MDYTTQNQMPPKGSGMATAALVVGIVSLTGLLCLLPSIIFGGLAIVLAILSRGNAKKIMSQAKVGMVMGIISITLSFGMIGASVYTVFSNPDFMEQYEILYEQMYGSSFEEDMNSLFPGFSDGLETPDSSDFPNDTF